MLEISLERIQEKSRQKDFRVTCSSELPQPPTISVKILTYYSF